MLKLNPGQRRAGELLAGPQRHTCLVGGSRSGKTTIFVKSIVVRALRSSGSRHGLFRHHANAAKNSVALDTLPKVVRLAYPGLVLDHNKADNYFTFPNGSEFWVGGLDDQARIDKILGREFATMAFNECSEIPYASITTALTRLAQVVAVDGTGRRGEDGKIIPGTEEVLRQRAYYDLNPVGKMHWTNVQFGDKMDPVSRQPLVDPEEYERLFLNPSENADNLDPAYVRSLENLPERQRKRFYEGVYVDELEGALWSYEGLDRGRVDELPVDQRRRVVVAVDPSGAASMMDNTRDEIGITVSALGVDGHGYLLADRSLRDAPAAWARQAITAYHEFQADCIVAETNYGGAMVEAVIKGADPNVPVHVVTASRGKAVRAEPIASLYGDPPEFKRIMIHHVGRFPMLEDQLVAFTTAGYRGEGSPDRADSLVWGMTDLMLGSDAEAWINYFAGQAAEAQAASAVKVADRPSTAPAVPASVDNSVADAYRRITGKVLGKKDLCAWCNEPLGSTRATDGEDSYHDDERGCYRKLLARSTRSASPVTEEAT